MIQILRYIKENPSKGLLHKNRKHTWIVGCSNVDWASYSSDHHSTSCYCILIGRNLISSRGKKQNVVEKSSAKAKYQATTCELICLKQLI